MINIAIHVLSFNCHPREGGDPGRCIHSWIPAFAGMINEKMGAA